ncbi:MAG: Fic family protein [Moraxellaceae bacterium]|nr:MAG: Fic family protein [Moraxellaceae bacterium]
MNDLNTLPNLPPTINYADLIPELVTAHRALASLDTLVRHTWRASEYNYPLLEREALDSLKLDGAVVSIEDILNKHAGVMPPTERIRDEISQAGFYSHNLLMSNASFQHKPLDEEWLKDVHRDITITSKTSRSDVVTFRQESVDYSGSETMYTPPTSNDVKKYIANIFDFYANENGIDNLIKIGICHYQFEAIQPFESNNGRTGRLLSQTMLVKKDLLYKPVLQFSSYFERNRQNYFEALRGVSTSNDWTGWLKFFLNAITAQSHDTTKLIQEYLNINERFKPKVVKASNEYGEKVFSCLIRQPVFTASDLRTSASIDAVQTAYNIIDILLKERLIFDATPDRQRGKRYECDHIIRKLYKTTQQMY